MIIILRVFLVAFYIKLGDWNQSKFDHKTNSFVGYIRGLFL